MEALVRDMAAQYEAGATVYQLAAEFGCNRATVAERLQRAGGLAASPVTFARTYRRNGAPVSTRAIVGDGW